MTANAPLFWIQQLDEALEGVQEIPLWGFPPAFPLEECTQKISELLGAPDLLLTIEDAQVVRSDKIASDLGTNPLSITWSLAPLQEPFHWLMAQEDVRKLCALTLLEHPNLKGFSTLEFQEGFYRFLALKAAELLDDLNAFADLSLRMAPPSPLPSQGALCIDVSLRIAKQTLWSKIVLSHAFRHEFKEHFSAAAFSLSTAPLAHKVEVLVKVEVGHVILKMTQWKSVHVGDFILLDTCSYDPAAKKGTAVLSVNGIPLLYARIKADSLKIVDYAFYHEENMNENDNISDDEEQTEEEHLWSSEEKEGEEESFIDEHDIPISLVVEVARLKVNVDKLLQLKPGNVLELPVRPEQGVVISIGDKKIAKGELVKLGDVLGVKITHV